MKFEFFRILFAMIVVIRIFHVLIGKCRQRPSQFFTDNQTVVFLFIRFFFLRNPALNSILLKINLKYLCINRAIYVVERLVTLSVTQYLLYYQ